MFHGDRNGVVDDADLSVIESAEVFSPVFRGSLRSVNVAEETVALALAKLRALHDQPA